MTKHLRRALEVASESTCHFRHGAVLVRGGVVIAEATNKRRFDPDSGDWTKSHEHAEAAAIRIAGERARGSKLFVARISNAGDPMLSEPCDNCKVLIEAAGVRRIYWSM